MLINFKKNLIIIVSLFSFLNSLYAQKEVDFDKYEGVTEDGRICLSKGKYFFTVDTLGNNIGPKVRIDERARRPFAFPNNLYIDYDPELISYAFFDGNGKQITPYNIKDFSYGNNIFTLNSKITVQTKFGPSDKYVPQFKDLNLKTLFEIFDKDYAFTKTLIYSNQYSFSDGLCIVKKNNRFGFINKSGKVVIPISFEEAKPFSNGFAAVRGRDSNDRQRWGFIDKSGKLVIPYKFKNEPDDFSSEMAIIKDDDSGLKGAIDKTGNLIVPTLYGNSLLYEIKPFKNGIGLFIESGNRGYVKCQMINTKNEIVRDIPFARSMMDIPAVVFDSGYVLQESQSKTRKNSAQQEVVDYTGKTIFIADNVDYTIREVLPNRYMYYTSYDIEKGFRNAVGKIMFKSIKK